VARNSIFNFGELYIRGMNYENSTILVIDNNLYFKFEFQINIVLKRLLQLKEFNNIRFKFNKVLAF
jgi:hypothetical protein